MLWGTDLPFLDPVYLLGRLACTTLSDEAKRKILGLNLQAALARRRQDVTVGFAADIEDNGRLRPGFGEIDHYRLLQPVAFTGLDMPLACENIFEPLVERPKDPTGVDALARRAREYLETVTRGLQGA